MIVAGNDRDHIFPGAGIAPDPSRAARSEKPLVAAGNEAVAAQLWNREILHTQTVHAIHAEERLIELKLGSIGTGTTRRARLSENRRDDFTPLPGPRLRADHGLLFP